MFEVLFTQASTLKHIFDAIKELTEQACFDVTKTGISLQAMDSSHVSLITLLLRADKFSHYRCDRDLRLGLNLKVITKLLKTANNDDQITLRAEDEGDHIVIVIENKDGSKFSSYEVKLMEIEQEILGINDAKYAAIAKLKSSDFLKVTRDLLQVGDTVAIEVNKEGITFSVSGPETQGCVTLRQRGTVDEDSAGTEIALEEPISLSFALRFLSLFTKATGLSDQVTISLSQEAPLCVAYEIENNIGSVRYFLAPKIEEESEGAAPPPSAATTTTTSSTTTAPKREKEETLEGDEDE